MKKLMIILAIFFGVIACKKEEISGSIFTQNSFVGTWQELGKPIINGISYSPTYENTTVSFTVGATGNDLAMSVVNAGFLSYTNIKVTLTSNQQFVLPLQQIGYYTVSGTGEFTDKLTIKLTSIDGSSINFVGTKN